MWSAERKKLIRQILTAIWTCVGLEIIVLFSIWQSLPVVGQRLNAILVGVIFLIWTTSLIIYRLTIGRQQIIASRRKQLYQDYLP